MRDRTANLHRSQDRAFETEAAAGKCARRARPAPHSWPARSQLLPIRHRPIDNDTRNTGAKRSVSGDSTPTRAETLPAGVDNEHFARLDNVERIVDGGYVEVWNAD